jgi:DNA-binding NarL/FixJ family response regulator
MLERVGISKLRAVPTARWRSIGGLAIMLLTIGQSARTLEDPLARTAVWVLALVMSIAWLVQLTRLSLDATASEIQHAIRTVHAGEALLDPSVQRRLLERTLGGALAPVAPAYPDGLTQREAEVLREIAAGRSNREIADRLSIGEATVKTHVNNIFSKAGLRDRAQAVVYAVRHGLAS